MKLVDIQVVLLYHRLQSLLVSKQRCNYIRLKLFNYLRLKLFLEFQKNCLVLNAVNEILLRSFINFFTKSDASLKHLEGSCLCQIGCA